MIGLRAVALGAALALTPLAARAELDSEAYQTEAGGLSEAERVTMRARLAAEIASERAREDEVRRAAQAAAERVATERAARPLGERLVEARCLSCHDAGQIDSTVYGTPGWTMTVVRMAWLNGARIEPGERRVIVAYLSARHPDRSLVEWALVIIAGAIMLTLGLWAWVWRRK